MKGQRWIVGGIIRIPLSDNKFGYAQMLEKGYIAVFNTLTEKEYSIDDVINLDILFIVSIYSNIIPAGTWPKIGKAEIRKDLLRLPFQFIQDQLDPEIFEIYDPESGTITSANKEQCLGLECCAVWEAKHVEDRIMDHFMGKKNVWLEQLEIK